MDCDTLRQFDASWRTCREWLTRLGQAGNFLNERQAFLQIRDTLHTVRARLPGALALELGLRLPLLLRAVYFEGWHPPGEFGSDDPVRDELFDRAWSVLPDPMRPTLGWLEQWIDQPTDVPMIRSPMPPRGEPYPSGIRNW